MFFTSIFLFGNYSTRVSAVYVTQNWWDDNIFAKGKFSFTYQSYVETYLIYPKNDGTNTGLIRKFNVRPIMPNSLFLETIQSTFYSTDKNNPFPVTRSSGTLTPRFGEQIYYQGGSAYSPFTIEQHFSFTSTNSNYTYSNGDSLALATSFKFGMTFSHDNAVTYQPKFNIILKAKNDPVLSSYDKIEYASIDDLIKGFYTDLNGLPYDHFDRGDLQAPNVDDYEELFPDNFPKEDTGNIDGKLDDIDSSIKDGFGDLNDKIDDTVDDIFDDSEIDNDVSGWFDDILVSLEEAFGPIGTIVTFPINILSSISKEHVSKCSIIAKVDIAPNINNKIDVGLDFCSDDLAEFWDILDIFVNITMTFLVFYEIRHLIKKWTGFNYDT